MYVTQIKICYKSLSNHTRADSDLRGVFCVYTDFVRVYDKIIREINLQEQNTSNF